MTAQLDLFTKVIDTPIPASRRLDPVTSYEAEKHADINGQRKQVLEVLKAHPMSTSFEIDQYAGFEREIAHRRLPELEKLNFARRLTTADGKLKVVVCTVHKTRCCLWEAI